MAETTAENMEAPEAHHDDSGHGHEQLPGTIGHVTPWQNLVKVLVLLLILTVITVVIAQFDLGRLNVVGAIGVASIKASVVALFFMHLRYDKRFNFWILVCSLGFVAWMVGYILLDTALYQDNIKQYQQDQIRQQQGT